MTALSGSGPAYVFFFLEAMTQAGVEMGLPAEQALPAGGGHLRRRRPNWRARPSDPPEVLRERVTSKGGTTHAAITSMEADGVQALFVKALHAACTARARNWATSSAQAEALRSAQTA